MTPRSRLLALRQMIPRPDFAPPAGVPAPHRYRVGAPAGGFGRGPRC